MLLTVLNENWYTNEEIIKTLKETISYIEDQKEEVNLVKNLNSFFEKAEKAMNVFEHYWYNDDDEQYIPNKEEIIDFVMELVNEVRRDRGIDEISSWWFTIKKDEDWMITIEYGFGIVI